MSRVFSKLPDKDSAMACAPSSIGWTMESTMSSSSASGSATMASLFLPVATTLLATHARSKTERRNEEREDMAGILATVRE